MAVVRVVAGSARGRRLGTPGGRDVRPTSDRVREATFNALTSMDALADARVVDLFAGSGALGIEALSRGVASVVFVEPGRVARAMTEANLDSVGFKERSSVEVHASTAQAHLGACPPDTYDLAFADPPYAFDAWDELFGLLDDVMAPGGVVVVESDRPLDPAEFGASGWGILRQKRYGGTVVGINVRLETPSRTPGAKP